MGMGKKKEPLIYKGSHGGRNRTRTCDPIDVNDVLYQLSHATIYGNRFWGVVSASHPRIPGASGLALTAFFGGMGYHTIGKRLCQDARKKKRAAK